MSDKIYLPDTIPDGYIYGVYNNGYITLYNKPSGHNETLQYYRIYYGYSSGLVSSGYTTFGQYTTTTFEELPVSREFFDRPDAFSIVFIVMVLTVFGLWLFNLMTSVVKKNGLLSGLL